MSSKVDLKVVLLGKEYGGKTSLAERFLYTRFQENVPYQNTIGAAYGAKKIQIDGKPVHMAIWDTAGSERYRAMSRIYYRGAWAAIICYDITDKESFERAEYWVKELKQHEENCKIYLCGTKLDIAKDRNRNTTMIDYHSVSDYADEIKGELVETSSKTGENVAHLFNKIATDYLSEAHLRAQTNAGGIGLTESTESTQNKRSCCFR